MDQRSGKRICSTTNNNNDNSTYTHLVARTENVLLLSMIRTRHIRGVDQDFYVAQSNLHNVQRRVEADQQGVNKNHSICKSDLAVD